VADGPELKEQIGAPWDRLRGVEREDVLRPPGAQMVAEQPVGAAQSELRLGRTEERRRSVSGSSTTTFLSLAPPARSTRARQRLGPPRQRTVTARSILSSRRTASITSLGCVFWM
jgi:hypothetical protein